MIELIALTFPIWIVILLGIFWMIGAVRKQNSPTASTQFTTQVVHSRWSRVRSIVFTVALAVLVFYAIVILKNA